MFHNRILFDDDDEFYVIKLSIVNIIFKENIYSWTEWLIIHGHNAISLRILRLNNDILFNFISIDWIYYVKKQNNQLCCPNEIPHTYHTVLFCWSLFIILLWQYSWPLGIQLSHSWKSRRNFLFIIFWIKFNCKCFMCSSTIAHWLISTYDEW